VKKVVYLPAAQRSLLRHRKMSGRILAKMEAFADSPESFANLVTELKGSRARRLRIGGFRVIFEETDTEFVVTAIGPRGSVYD
jgi:mRNA interferase RelE/StbE